MRFLGAVLAYGNCITYPYVGEVLPLYSQEARVSSQIWNVILHREWVAVCYSDLTQSQRSYSFAARHTRDLSSHHRHRPGFLTHVPLPSPGVNVVNFVRVGEFDFQVEYSRYGGNQI